MSVICSQCQLTSLVECLTFCGISVLLEHSGSGSSVTKFVPFLFLQVFTSPEHSDPSHGDPFFLAVGLLHRNF